MLNKLKSWVLYSKSFLNITLVVVVALIGSWLISIFLADVTKEVKEVKYDVTDIGFAAYSDNNDYETNLKLVLEREKRMPNDVTTLRKKARVLIMQGERYEEGMLIAEDLTAIRDMDNESVDNLSFAYTKLGYPVLGEYYAKKSLEIGQSQEGNLALADAYYAQKRYDDAVNHYKSAVSISTVGEEYYKRLVDCCLKLGDWKAAEAYATLRVRFAKNETYYFDLLHEHYAAVNELDSILFYGELYFNVCMESEIPRIGEMLGDLLTATKTGKGQMLDAGKYYSRAFSVNGNYDVLFKAAKAYAAAGDKKTAKKFLDECIAASPDFAAQAAQIPEMKDL